MFLGVPTIVVVAQSVGVFLPLAARLAAAAAAGGIGEVVLVGVLVSPLLTGVAVYGVVQLAAVVAAIFVT